MFDDFVQSSSQQPSASARNGNFASSQPSSRIPSTSSRQFHQPPQHYDDSGFEQQGSADMPGPTAVLDPIAALETGFISSDPSSSSASPIFQLGRVQYAFSAPLALMTVSSNILTMCLYSYPNPSQGTNPFPSSPPKLVRINLDDPEITQEADVPISPAPRTGRGQPAQDPATLGPHKMFSDPTGRHLILAMRNGDNYYWASGWKKARLLPKLKGIVLESVAWSKASSSSSTANRRKGQTPSVTLSSTYEILLGTRSGDVYEALITAPVGSDPDDGDFFDKLARRTAGSTAEKGDVDRVLRHMYTLPERQPITGLTAEPFPRRPQDHSRKLAGSADTKSTSDQNQAVILITTSTRIYELVGPLAKSKPDETESQSLYETLFQPYRGDAMPNLKSELPGDLPYSELHTWTASSSQSASALAWLTGPGIYHGLLSYPRDPSTGDSVIDSANLLPYPVPSGEGGDTRQTKPSPEESFSHVSASIPVSIALTEFHLILLYQNHVVAISSLDDRVIFEETLPLKSSERVIGTAVDVTKKTIWVYTDSSIFELVITQEDRDVWRVYLNRGSFDTALKYAKAGLQRGTVLSYQGDRFFAESKYIQAAQCYAQTFMRAFEEIVLRFIDAGQRDALRYYLVMRLERLDKADVTQRVMLATWLIEIYLCKINELEDIAAAEAASQDVENYRLETAMITEELYQFFNTYKDILVPRTTFDLIKKHGRSDAYLQFASAIGDHNRIVQYHVQEGDWTQAIDAINRQDSLELYYTYASVLMRHAPVQTVNCWTRQSRLDPKKLIPALLQHKSDLEAGETDQAITYLRQFVDKSRNTDSAIHNLFLTLLARRASKYPDIASTKTELLHFIDEAKSNPLTGQPYFDLDYALRTCSSLGQKEACVRVYARMGLFEAAVNLAIHEKEIELACTCAELAESDRDLRKKLWLKVAREVVRTTSDIKSALAFLRRTDLIAVEDVLPFFPDFVVIDDCRDDICQALEGYAAHIERLKDEMDEATRSAAAIQQDTARLSQRFVTLDADQKCLECRAVLVQRQFYVFPCRHAFHADCLIGQVTKSMPTRSLRKLLELQQQMSALTSGLVPALPNQVLANMGFLKDGSKAMVTAANEAARGFGNVSAAVGLDKLREMVVPDAVISAISAGVSVSVAGGRRVLAPLDPFSNPATDWVAGSRSAAQRRAAVAQVNGLNGVNGADHDTNGTVDAPKKVATARSVEDQERIQQLTDQLDALIASSCPLCDGAANSIGRPFISNREDTDEWTL